MEGHRADQVWFDEVPLFTVGGKPHAGREHQACDRCLAGAWDTIDGLRVRGWIIYDGTSQTGRELHVRLCRACQRKDA